MTIAELHQKLKECGITEDKYYLHGLYGSKSDEDKYAMIIKAEQGIVKYEVYFKERNEKHSIRLFTSESLACDYFYNRLKDNKAIEDKYSN